MCDPGHIMAVSNRPPIASDPLTASAREEPRRLPRQVAVGRPERPSGGCGAQVSGGIGIAMGADEARQIRGL